jgi:hypothetical protein
MAVCFIVGPFIYISGDIRPLLLSSYDIADLLYGPLWAASLISVVLVLREQIGQRAPRRMTLALIGAALAGVMMVTIAVLRKSNRTFLATYPEEDPAMSRAAFLAWITVAQAIISVGQHFLGWTLLLIASAGWTSRTVPRVLCGILVVAGVQALLVYLSNRLDVNVMLFGVIWGIWQGIIFLRAKPPEGSAGTSNPANQAGQAQGGL